MKINDKEITIPKNGLSTKDMVDLFDSKQVTIQKFASKNNVPYVGEGNRKNYQFFEDDIINFMNRPKPGRRW